MPTGGRMPHHWHAGSVPPPCGGNHLWLPVKAASLLRLGKSDINTCQLAAGCRAHWHAGSVPPHCGGNHLWLPVKAASLLRLGRIVASGDTWLSLEPFCQGTGAAP